MSSMLALAAFDWFGANPALLLVVVVVWGVFWIMQFVQFMALEDALFPGRFDKLIWGAAFVFLPPLAPFAFRLWKAVRLAGRKGS